MVLGRYNRNSRSVDLNTFKRVAPNLSVEFSTIHGSKGLEADYVIVDRVEASGLFAFPSLISDGRVLRLVLPQQERFPHAEERRLLYVALTRARRRVYVVTRNDGESPFVMELLGSATQGAAVSMGACPYCKNGRRVLRDGKHGSFWTCSRYPDCSGKARAAHRV
jgi:DNA helicase IV